MAENTQDFFSKKAEKWAEDYPLEDHPEQYLNLLQTFTDFMDDSGKILDAGCGHGKDSEYFEDNGFNVIGIDFASGMIEYAKQNRPGEYRQMDIKDLEFEEESFDGVWCNTVMQFLAKEEMKKAISELERVLKPGGVFYSSFKIGDGYIIRTEYGSETKRYQIPEEEAKKTVQDNGMEILETRKAPLNGLTVLNIYARKQ